MKMLYFNPNEVKILKALYRPGGDYILTSFQFSAPIHKLDCLWWCLKLPGWPSTAQYGKNNIPVKMPTLLNA